MQPTISEDQVRARVADVGGWYHTIQLPGGVATPGYYDHRSVISKLPFPESLEGARCVDLASSDGMFAFEMARRGGDVVSVDLDDTAQQDWQGKEDPNRTGGRGRAHQAFEVARSMLDLDVERVDLNLYDVSPQRLGTFDFAFMGNILLHLSDPARALRAVRSVVSGVLLSFEVVSLPLTLLRPRTPCAQLCQVDDARWWTANLAGHKRLLAAAGFEVVDSGFPLFQRFGEYIQGQRPKPPWQAPDPIGQQLAFWLFNRPFGVPSGWALCRPT